MYKKAWFKNKVTSSDGFSVELKTFNTLLYRDASGTISCFVEPLVRKRGGGDILLDTSSMILVESNTTVVDPQKAIVVNRVVEAMGYLKIKIVKNR